MEPKIFAHKLMNNKTHFDSYIYTSPDKLNDEFNRRNADSSLIEYIHNILNFDTPPTLKGISKSILFRNVASPSYETILFFEQSKKLGLDPYIFEYTEDLFNDRNESKYFFGKLRLIKGTNKHGEHISEGVVIINFNESNNKKISSLHTRWGENFVDFHHRIFNDYVQEFKAHYIDISDWLHLYGSSAKDYYKPFLALFLQNSVLFENLYVNEDERDFIEKIILPSFLEIENESGYKPLIIPLAPLETAIDVYWCSYPYELKEKLK